MTVTLEYEYQGNVQVHEVVVALPWLCELCEQWQKLGVAMCIQHERESKEVKHEQGVQA